MWDWAYINIIELHARYFRNWTWPNNLVQLVSRTQILNISLGRNQTMVFLVKVHDRIVWTKTVSVDVLTCTQTPLYSVPSPSIPQKPLANNPLATHSHSHVDYLSSNLPCALRVPTLSLFPR